MEELSQIDLMVAQRDLLYPAYTGAAFSWDYSDISLNDLQFSIQELISMAYLAHIRRKVYRDKFTFIGSFDGRHRAGKSLTASTWGYLLDDTFWPNYEARLVREPKEFVDVIESFEHDKVYGGVIQVDEAGVALSSADWYERFMKTVFKMVQMFGYLRPIVLFTSPVKDFIDARLRKMFHAYYAISRYTLDETFITPYHLQYSSVMGKTYYKKPVLKIAGQRYMLRRIRMSMPPAKLVDKYEELAGRRKKAMLGDFHADMRKEAAKEERTEVNINDLIKHVANNSIIYEAQTTKPEEPKISLEQVEYRLKLKNRMAKFVKQEAEKILKTTYKEKAKLENEKKEEVKV